MESKEDFQVFPWSTTEEFKNVAQIILNLDYNSNLLSNIDFLKELQWSERQLIIWRSKTNSTLHLYEIDVTHSIVNCLLHEFLPKLNKQNNDLINNLKQNNEIDQSDEQMNISTDNLQTNLELFNSKSFNLLNEETISCLYSNSILKFFKMLSYYDIINGNIERLLSRSEANLTRICDKLDFPKYIIEYRHRIAHNKLPSFDQLNLAIQIALNWIQKNYWFKLLKQLDGQMNVKQQIYEQTIMLLTNLFEQDEQFDKKQKLNNSKFNKIDRKQLSLLNDTLYDLLNDDFYTTLHSITLYILNSTKDYLDHLNDEQIIKWIENDEFNLMIVLNSNQLEKRKREQLIPNQILNSLKPIFQLINRQLSSINQLLFYLYSIIQHQQIDLNKTAKIWFIQILCSLLNNLNYKNSKIINLDKHRSLLTEFEKCFGLSEIQLQDLKWIHLFTILLEQPIMNRINLLLIKKFYPLVSFRYSKDKFNKFCELLSIYLDLNDDLNKSNKKKLINLDNNYYDLNCLENQNLSGLILDELTNFEDQSIPSDIDWSRMNFGFI